MLFCLDRPSGSTQRSLTMRQLQDFKKRFSFIVTPLATAAFAMEDIKLRLRFRSFAKTLAKALKRSVPPPTEATLGYRTHSKDSQAHGTP